MMKNSSLGREEVDPAKNADSRKNGQQNQTNGWDHQWNKSYKNVYMGKFVYWKGWEGTKVS